MRSAWLVVAVGCGSSSSTPPEIDAPAISAHVEDVASGLDYPTSIAVDGTHVYVVTGGDTVSRVVKSGGSIEPVVTAQLGPTSLDVTTDRLCWINSGTHGADFRNGSVRCAAKTGGAETKLSDGFLPSSLAIQGGTVYWTEIDGEVVRKIGLDGTGLQTIDSSPTSKVSIAVAANRIAWTASGPGPDVVLVENGTPTTLTSDEYAPDTIRIAGDDIYWLTQHALSDNGAVRVWRAGSVQDIVADEYAPRGLVVEDGVAYWTSKGRIRTQTGTLVDGRDTIAGFASDGEYLYWTEPDRGAIFRVRRGTGSASP